MLYVLVVIHNRTCEESAACRSLLAQTDRAFHVLIYDNSDSDYGIRKSCEEKGWTYLGGNGNRGLSVAYNSALDYLESESAEGYICILDDDTCFEVSFIKETAAALRKTESAILLPVLTQNGRILSPWREKGRKHFKSFAECASEPQKNILAFNSGMIVRLDVFSDYRYDEKLFLDCVDISFLNEMKRCGKTIGVVPIYCRQDFSGTGKTYADAAMKRYEIYSSDVRAYYGKHSLRSIFTLLKRAAHLALMYRSLRPFAIFMCKEKQ